MNTKNRSFLGLVILSIMLVSCGPVTATPAPVTQSPIPPSLTLNKLAVILVADTYAVSGPGKSSDNNCSVTPDGLGQSYGSRGSSTIILKYPHGRYVYDDATYQLEKDGFKLESSDPTPPNITGRPSDPANDPGYGGVTNQVLSAMSFVKRADLYVDAKDNKQGILVVAVDTNDLNFNDISNNIPEAIGFFSNTSILFGNASLPVASQIVVNMSFVFVPCDSVVDSILNPYIKNLLRNNKLDSAFENFDSRSNDQFSVKYLAEQYDVNLNKAFYEGVNSIKPLGDLRSRLEILKFNDVDNAIFNAFVVNLIYDSTVDRSWLKSFDDFQGKLRGFGNVVYVGAAGNFENPYPLAPASWDFVISVSSDGSTSDVDCRKDVADYSNCAEVKVDGVYYNSQDIVGTSFAAPKISARSAINLLLTQPAVAIQNSCPLGLNTATWDNAVYNCAP